MRIDQSSHKKKKIVFTAIIVAFIVLFTLPMLYTAVVSTAVVGSTVQNMISK